MKDIYWYISGEDIDGNYYDFSSYASDVDAVIAECQELLESLDGGLFMIYDKEGHFVTRVEY